MTYLETSQGITISHDRAIRELKDHGLTFKEDIDSFYEDLGKNEYYEASEVLEWLGY